MERRAEDRTVDPAVVIGREEAGVKEDRPRFGVPVGTGGEDCNLKMGVDQWNNQRGDLEEEEQRD